MAAHVDGGCWRMMWCSCSGGGHSVAHGLWMVCGWLAFGFVARSGSIDSDRILYFFRFFGKNSQKKAAISKKGFRTPKWTAKVSTIRVFWTLFWTPNSTKSCKSCHSKNHQKNNPPRNSFFGTVCRFLTENRRILMYFVWILSPQGHYFLTFFWAFVLGWNLKHFHRKTW